MPQWKVPWVRASRMASFIDNIVYRREVEMDNFGLDTSPSLGSAVTTGSGYSRMGFAAASFGRIPVRQPTSCGAWTTQLTTMRHTPKSRQWRGIPTSNPCPLQW